MTIPTTTNLCCSLIAAMSSVMIDLKQTTYRLRRRLIVDGVVDSGILHLVPGLFPPMNLFGGIGIRFVIGRVVVVRNGSQLRAFRNSKGSREYVVSLPVEIVM